MNVAQATGQMQAGLQALATLGRDVKGQVIKGYNQNCWFGSEVSALAVLERVLPSEAANRYHRAALALAALLSPVGGGARTMALVNLIGPRSFHAVGTLIFGGDRGHLYWPGIDPPPFGLLIDTLPPIDLPPLIQPVGGDTGLRLSYFDLLALKTSEPRDRTLFAATLRALFVPPVSPPDLIQVTSRVGPGEPEAFLVPPETISLAAVGLLCGWHYLLASPRAGDVPTDGRLIPMTAALDQSIESGRGSPFLWGQLPNDVRRMLDNWQAGYRAAQSHGVSPTTVTIEEVLTAVQALLPEPRSEWGRWTHTWVLEHSPTLLGHMPGSEAYLRRFPECLATQALAEGYLSNLPHPVPPEGKNLFSTYLTYRIYLEGRPSRDDFHEERAFAIVHGYFQDFLSEQHYFMALLQTAFRLIDYEEKTGGLFEAEHQQARRLSQDLIFYLARRKNRPIESLEESVSAVMQRNREEGFYLIPPGREGHEVLHSMKDWLTRQLRFLTRLLAVDDSLIERFGERIQSDFPETNLYRAGRQGAITWEEIESVRQSHLPPRPGGTKPTLMIVGIGKEWGQVERYVRAGYNLVLVDIRAEVSDYFGEHRVQLRKLSEEHGAQIEFICEDIRSSEWVRRYEGQIDCVEYQNVTELFGADTDSIDRMLRPGGLFVEFHPFLMNRGLLVQRGYGEILRRSNIPGVLGTTSERDAYPLGNHFLILKKP